MIKTNNSTDMPLSVDLDNRKSVNEFARMRKRVALFHGIQDHEILAAVEMFENRNMVKMAERFKEVIAVRELEVAVALSGHDK